jgi:hypothetical protein
MFDEMSKQNFDARGVGWARDDIGTRMFEVRKTNF